MKLLRHLCLLTLAVAAAAVEPMTAAGERHSLYLADDGTVWAWGDNSYGQLGDSGAVGSSSDVPIQVPGLSNVVQISAGFLYSLALDVDGRVWMWGSNSNGQRGDGTTGGTITSPEWVSGAGTCRQITSGGWHAVAITSNGTIISWGYNGDGACGTGDFASAASPRALVYSYAWREVAAGQRHTIAVRYDGYLYCWGSDAFGQIGNGATTGNQEYPTWVSSFSNEIKSVGAGANHSLAVHENGQVHAWGDNDYGQCGTGGTVGVDAETPVYTGVLAATRAGGGTYHSWATRANGYSAFWGRNHEGQLRMDTSTAYRSSPIYYPFYRAQATGPLANHVLVIDVDGAVFGWGDNFYGQLGLGNSADPYTTAQRTLAGWPVDRISGIAMGYNHSHARGSDGRVWSWGANSLGQGGDGAGLTYNVTPTAAAIDEITMLDAGSMYSDFSVAVSGRGAGYAWGYNFYGQHGDGTTSTHSTPVGIAGGNLFIDIAGGSYHSLGITYFGSVRSWGRDNYGQLGNDSSLVDVTTGPVTVSGLAGAVQVSAGNYHSMALLADGTVWCWGYNGVGAIGDGTYTNRSTPVQVTGLPRIIDIAAGAYHCVALACDGTVWTWGYNFAGQLGNNTVGGSSNVPVQVQYASGTLTGYRSIGSGDYHGYAIHANGSLYAWGQNTDGQLGNNSFVDSDHAVFVSGSGRVFAVEGGYRCGIMLDADGQVYAMGRNTSYQLGDGTTTSRELRITTDQAWLPIVSIDTAGSTLNANETGPSSGYVKLTRQGSTAGALTVSFTMSGSAGQGTDYASTGNQATIPAGSSSVLVPITPIDDLIDEDSESATLSLNASADRYRLDASNSATVTIADNDTAGIAVTPTSGLQTTEAAGPGAQFTIVLATRPTANVTVNLSSSNPGEGVPAVSSVSFTPLTWNSPQAVTVNGVDDDVDDDDVTYTIITAQAVSSDPKYSAINPSNVSLKNIDDDTAGFMTASDGADVLEQPIHAMDVDYVSANQLRVNDADISDVTIGMAVEIVTGTDAGAFTYVSAVNAGTGDITLSSSVLTAAGNFEAGIGHISVSYIRLATKPTAGVTINLSATDTTEGSVTPTQITLDADDWNTWQPIYLFGVDDDLDDGDQNYAIKTAAAISSDPKYNGLDPADYAVTTVDDDQRGLLITETSPGTFVTEGGTTDTYTVQLTSQPTATVTVTLSPQNGEVTTSPSSIDFTTSNWSNPVTVTVTAVDDNFIDPGENGLIRHTASGGDYTGLAAEDLAVTVTDDDLAGAIVSPISLNITETQSSIFDLSLTASPATGTTVALSCSSDDTAVASLSAQPLVIYFGDAGSTGDGSSVSTPRPWNDPATITVLAEDDGDTIDSFANIVITLDSTTDTDFAVIDPADVAITNKDDDVPGIKVTQSGGSTAVSESGTIDTYEVRLNSDPAGLVAVSVTAGSGVTVNPTTLYFDGTTWITNQTVTVTAIDDQVDESSPHNTSIAHAVAASASGFYPTSLSLPSLAVAITDDDTAGIAITPTSGLTTTEGGTVSTFGVVLLSQPTGNVEIDFVSSDTSEATVGPVSVTFTSGNWSSTQTVTVTGVDDSTDDGNQSFVITGSVDVANTADSNYHGRNVPTVSGTNTDDDAVGVTVVESGGSTDVDEDGGTDTYTIVLTSEPSGVVTIGIDTDDQVSTDTSTVYFGDSGSIGDGSTSTSPRPWNSAATITVSGIDDDFDEAAVHPGTVAHSASGAEYNGVSIASITANVSDDVDDDAGFTLTAISGTVREDFGISGILTLDSVSTVADVDGDSIADGLVQLDPADLTTLGLFVGQLVIFDQGTNDTLQTVILAVNDLNDQVTVSGPVTNDPSDSAGSLAYVAGFQVSLASQPLATVQIYWQSSDYSEGFPFPDSLTFTPDNWDQPQVVNVVGEDDDIDDGDQTFTIDAVSTQSLDPTYNGLLPGSGVSVTSIDDDTRGITLTGAGTGELVTTEIGGSDSFTIVLDSEPTDTVTIGFTSSDGNQGTVSPSSVTFTAVDWFEPRTVVVTGTDGDAADNGTDPGIAWTVVTSNTTISGDYSALAVTDPAVDNLAVNHPPNIDTPTSVAINEDAGATLVDLTGIDEGQTGEEGQVIVISASSSNPGIVPDPVVSYTDGDTTGTLTLTPVADASGTVVITITVDDQGSTANGGQAVTEVAFSVTVGAVNDAPVVDADGDGTPGNGYLPGGNPPAFTEGSGAIAIVDTDLLVTDVDSTTAQSATIALAAIPDGADESLDVDVGSTGISKSYNSLTGTLTLTAPGPLPLEDWQDVLRTLEYDNTSGVPTETDRSISIVLNDGSDDSAPDTITVTVTEVPFAPVVDLNGAGGGIDDSAAYDEGDGGVVVTTPALSVTDSDSPSIASGTVVVTNLLDSGQEVLDANTTGTSITLGFVEAAGVGTLTLTGPGTPGDFQSVLRSLTYTNTSENPDPTPRLIRFDVSDSGGTSTGAAPLATLTLSISPINDPPTITVADGGLDDQVAIGGTIALGNDDIDASDVDDVDGVLEFVVLLIPSQGELQLNSSPLALNGTFTLADLTGGNLQYVHTGITSADDGFALRARDDDGASSDLAVFNIDVTGDAPPAVTLSDTTALTWTEDDPPIAWDNLVDVLDPDSPNLDTGNLTVSIFAGGDGTESLTIDTALGVTVAPDNTVSVSGVDIGSVSGGTLGTNLVVTFNANATDSRVQTLLRSVEFSCDSQNPSSATRTVRVVINDGGVDSTPDDRDIAVIPVNDPPTIILPVAVVVPEIARTFTLDIDDPEGDAYTVTVDIQPSKGVPVAVNASDQFTYQAVTGLTGGDSFTITVDDGLPGGSVTLPVPVTISGPNQTSLRIANNPPLQVEETTTLIFTPQVTGAKSDATLTYELIGLTPGGDVNFNPGDGTLNWTNVPLSGTGFQAFGIIITDTTNEEAVYLPFLVAVVLFGSV